MQHAKDSFYIALRDRLSTINPKRVMILRGAERPAMLVEEAEPSVGEPSNDTFSLRWTTATFVELSVPLVRLECEIHYATCGSGGFSGLDRGRTMTEMDSELLLALKPMSARKMNFSSNPVIALQTYIFWTNALLSDLSTLRDKLQRTASVTVFSFSEQGEL